jgi:hypothetical protein
MCNGGCDVLFCLAVVAVIVFAGRVVGRDAGQAIPPIDPFYHQERAQ